MYYRYVKFCEKCGLKFLTNNYLQRRHFKCTGYGQKELKKRSNDLKKRMKTTHDIEWIRRFVYTRDKNKCQLCLEDLSNKYQRKHAHHIDNNRKNNDFKNLITLCAKCHQKVHNNWNKYKEYFNPKDISIKNMKQPRKKRKTKQEFFKNI